ncbi:SNF2 family N-terminal domain-containing protein [Lentinula aciculospora]|uniref:SNF2 family N-terminal domain-containing protein n=1 Tax=Lentinula aciculospora TaxID=153920 RepID=A0A9W9DPY5_9AGAR|nr:SNF2 family N-terminal domain-containing protein [Lentinula aciculospora]
MSLCLSHSPLLSTLSTQHENTFRPTILPNSFSDDVKPHPVFIPPGENAFGKISPQFGYIPRIETSKQFAWSGSEIPKAKPKYRGVKVEEVADEDNSLSGSQAICRSGPRSEPLSSSTFYDGQGIPIGTPDSSAKPEEGVFKLLNEHRSQDYHQFDTKLGYSDYELKLHQVFARHWMANQESGGRQGGIVADEMGLGKTLQTLVLIKEDKIAREKCRPDSWDEEIRRMFHPDKRLTCIIYHGPDRESKYSKYPLEVLKQTDVVLTTYGILSSEHQATEDEAHEIRNASTKKVKAAFAVKAEFKWCLTGTPLWHALLECSEITQVNGRPILVLPELRVKIWDCVLSPSEREFYDALEARMQEILESLLSQLQTGDIRFYSTAWVLLLRLRQEIGTFIQLK